MATISGPSPTSPAFHLFSVASCYLFIQAAHKSLGLSVLTEQLALPMQSDIDCDAHVNQSGRLPQIPQIPGYNNSCSLNTMMRRCTQVRHDATLRLSVFR